jgi:hypothetical protein
LKIRLHVFPPALLVSVFTTSMSRFTWFTDAFSKKVENHTHAVDFFVNKKIAKILLSRCVKFLRKL